MDAQVLLGQPPSHDSVVTPVTKDETKFSDIGSAAVLLFIKNFCSTLAMIAQSLVLSSVLSLDQFTANNVISNTVSVWSEGKREKAFY